MSNFHILTQDRENKTVNVIFHIPIPSTGTNFVGKNWQTVIMEEQGGSSNIKSALPNISTTEESALKAGQLIEINTSVRFSSVFLTDAQRLQEITNEYNKAKAFILKKKQTELKFFGYEKNAE